MGRSTLHRILNSCSVSVRSSVQGLDYFTAEGANAFDDFEYVVDKLGDDCGMGFSWAKEKKEQLKAAKRYLKGDYKVMRLISLKKYAVLHVTTFSIKLLCLLPPPPLLPPARMLETRKVQVYV